MKRFMKRYSNMVKDVELWGEDDISLWIQRIGTDIRLDGEVVIIDDKEVSIKHFHRMVGKMLKNKLQHLLTAPVEDVDRLLENKTDTILVNAIISVTEYYDIDEMERVYLESNDNGCSSCMSKDDRDNGRVMTVREAVTSLSKMGYGVIQYDKELKFRCLVIELEGVKYRSDIYANKTAFGDIAKKLESLGYKSLEDYNGILEVYARDFIALPYLDYMDVTVYNVETGMMRISNDHIDLLKNEYEIGSSLGIEYFPKIRQRLERKNEREKRC